MRRYIALDIGGTEIKYALLDESAEVLVHDREKTPQGNANLRIPVQASDIISRLLKDYDDVHGVGISTAGVVDPDSGEIVFAGGTIPEYKGANLKAMVREQFALQACVTNDVNAAASGERWKGASRNCDSFYCITLGTGIGGAYYAHGKPVLGRHYRAGELGHSLFDKQSGTTYEQRASMSALLRRAKHELEGFTGDGRELFSEARNGNVACIELIDSWSDEIARGLAQVILVADPDLIVIGGGVSEQGEYLLSRIERRVMDHLPAGFAATPMRMAELGNRAALYGAVLPFYTYEMEG
ncbi:MAG: ROK family protein [Cohnella sp.]|nr:ROK family protein [Cohnella sp.]